MMLPHAVKKFGRYKAAIRHRTHLDNGAVHDRIEFIGTRYSVTDDGRDTFVTKGAPLYDSRDEALMVAKRAIEATEECSRRRREAYERSRAAAPVPNHDSEQP